MSEIQNPPAFPIAVPVDFQFCNVGMSLRDWFAAQALLTVKQEYPHWQICAWFGEHITSITREQITAKAAYAIADAMLAERAKADVQ